MLTLILAAIAGYIVLQLITHPTKSKVWVKLKQRRYQTKRFQVFPSFRIYYKNKVIHFHHWLNFGILLVISVFISSSFLDHSITRGFLLGGLIQGLSFSERNARQIIYPKEEDRVFAP